MIRKKWKRIFNHDTTLICSVLLFYSVTFLVSVSSGKDLPQEIVDVKRIIPSVVLDIRYHTAHNFIGRPIEGYLAPKCLLTLQAAAALMRVQEEIKAYSLSLKLYDCYRPRQAVNHFVRWAMDLSDTRMKKEFYPTVEKRNLFKLGYIARRSAHGRGSTVDLTLVPLPTPKQEKFIDGRELCECYFPVEKRFKDNSIDMGTGFDCFHPLSSTESEQVGPAQRRNRMLLKKVMEKYGFKNYRKEWWHYTLLNEPFPNTYFDFVIK